MILDCSSLTAMLFNVVLIVECDLCSCLPEELYHDIISIIREMNAFTSRHVFCQDVNEACQV
jgi:hypothetical protein